MQRNASQRLTTCATLKLLPWKATQLDRLLMPLPIIGFPSGAVVNGFFMPVFPCIRQGALADGLYGLNPRNTFWSLRPNVRARQHCLYRQNPRKTVPRFTPCVRPACLLGTG